MKLYYEAREVAGGWAGVVYHYDDTGNHEVIIWRSPAAPNQEKAIDLAGQWLDEQNLDAEMVY